MKKLLDDFTRNEILEISREFKRRRTFLNLTQQKLAKLSSLSQSIINKLEKGNVDPTYSTILKIEKALEKEEKITQVQAKTIMTSDIMSITNKTKLFKALEIMRESDFSQLLVTDNGNIIGSIYEKNILDAITQKVDIYKETVSKFIENMPIIVPPSYSAAELSFIFMNRKTKFVLVGEKNNIIGLITKSDLFKNN